MSSCQRGLGNRSRMLRHFNERRQRKVELHTWESAEICQSVSLHAIRSVFRETVTVTLSRLKTISAWFGSRCSPARSRNWGSWDTLRTSWLKNVMVTLWSRGASTWATKSSKYSLIPLKYNEVRAGRSARFSGGGRLPVAPRSGRDRGDWKTRRSDRSLAIPDMQVTMSSGEM